MILIKLLCNFIEIPLRHGCSPVNLLHIFRISFHKNTYGRLFLINGLEEVTKIYENMQNVQYCSKFAGFCLQLYYQRAPSQLFRKEKVYPLQLFSNLQSNYFSELFHISHIFMKGRQLRSNKLPVQDQQYKK